MTSKNGWHVIFGASGGVGHAVVRRLVQQKEPVRAVNRSGTQGVAEGVEVVKCDATDPACVAQVCRGAAVVYHCANAPYTDWPTLFAPITDGIVAGAASAGAKLVFADNLYMYGPVAGPLTEDLPNRAMGPKGRTRAQMATAIMQAHQSGKIPATIGRASDLFGPGVTNSMMGERVFRPALAGHRVDMLGCLDVPHTYTFVDDFAKGLVILGQRPEALGGIWHIPSALTLTTRQFLEKVFLLAGTNPKIRVAPRWLVSLMSRFHPMMRELKEMLYEFEKPFIVDHTKFQRQFGMDPTPHDQAIGRTLDWYRHNPK
jgi:nucleoside-diphosphate-sugar epimerase